MENKLDLPYPICVFISEAALATIKHSTIEVYSRQGTEWGGLLWGECFAHPAGGVVPVVVFATSGICRATPTSCDILPASWDAGERELNAQGLTELRCLGDYHSHPKMGVFLSEHRDVPSFWSCGHVPHWLSMVVDPWHNDYGVFTKNSPHTLHRIQTFLISQRILQALRLPEPVTASLLNQGPQPSLTGGTRYGQHGSE